MQLELLVYFITYYYFFIVLSNLSWNMSDTLTWEQEKSLFLGQLREKDNMIESMKQKTRDFVTKLKNDHNNALAIVEVIISNIFELN